MCVCVIKIDEQQIKKEKISQENVLVAIIAKQVLTYK